MKRKIQSIILLTALILSVITCLVGCATTGMERSEKTMTTMQTVADEINQIAAQMDATGASLEDLPKVGQSNVKSAFDSYSANVVKMVNLQEQFTLKADEMKARGKEYFAEWKKQGDAYTNPQIRDLSEQRRAALSEVYGKIAEASIGVKEVFQTYMSDIKEIQTFLSNDLTPKGINAITPITGKVMPDAAGLKDAMNRVQTAINAAKAEMAQQ
jgi:hypothetical protein